MSHLEDQIAEAMTHGPDPMTTERAANIVWDFLPLRIIAVVLLASGLLCWLAWQWMANEWKARFRLRSELDAARAELARAWRFDQMKRARMREEQRGMR